MFPTILLKSIWSTYKKGINIAICEQTETPDQAKEVIARNREVVRIITPGTILEDNLIGVKTNNFLLSVNDVRGISISWLIFQLAKYQHYPQQ